MPCVGKVQGFLVVQPVAHLAVTAFWKVKTPNHEYEIRELMNVCNLLKTKFILNYI